MENDITDTNKPIKVTMQGPGLCSMTFIAFLVLKLCHVIDWSWWWVTSPLWIPFAAIISVVVIIGVLWGIVSIFTSKGGSSC